MRMYSYAALICLGGQINEIGGLPKSTKAMLLYDQEETLVHALSKATGGTIELCQKVLLEDVHCCIRGERAIVAGQFC